MKEYGAGKSTPNKTSAWRSALPAVLVTVAIALVAAGMVFFLSDNGIMQGLVSKLPPHIEPFPSETQRTDAQATEEDKKPTPPVRELAKEPEEEGTTILSKDSAEASEQEEAGPEGEEPVGEFSREVTGEENGDAVADGEPIQTSRTVVVTVQEGDTIYGILNRQYGESNEVLLNAVRELNPEIEDLNLIRVGQEIRLPLNLEVAGQIQSMEREPATIEQIIGNLDSESGEEAQ